MINDRVEETLAALRRTSERRLTRLHKRLVREGEPIMAEIIARELSMRAAQRELDRIDRRIAKKLAKTETAVAKLISGIAKLRAEMNRGANG